MRSDTRPASDSVAAKYVPGQRAEVAQRAPRPPYQSPRVAPGQQHAHHCRRSATL